MATKICTANIFIGEPHQNIILKCIIVKKLPLHIILSNSFFIEKLISLTGDKIWTTLKMNKITQLPQIRIDFIKEIGIVNKETHEEI